MSDEQCVAIIAAILKGADVVAKEIYEKGAEYTWSLADVGDYIADARKYLAAAAQPSEEPHA